MAGKSYKYEKAEIRMTNAHIWHGHITKIFKRSCNILNCQTLAGFHVLVYCGSNEEADQIKNLILKGLPMCGDEE